MKTVFKVEKGRGIMADFIILLILAMAVFFAVRRTIRVRKTGGCGCGCSSCHQKEGCTTNKREE